MKTIHSVITIATLSLASTCALVPTSQGQIFVSSDLPNGYVGEYTTSGTPINPSLIPGIPYAGGVVISGNNLFVASQAIGSGPIGEYTTSGAIVNPSFIPGFVFSSMTISGNNLFAAGRDSSSNPTIGEYTTSGATVNANLIPGVPNGINGIVVSGNNMAGHHHRAKP